MSSATTVKKVAIAERHRMALDLRIQGSTFEQIAARLRQVPGIPKKYSKEAARLDVTAALATVQSTNAELAEHLLHLELERYDALIAMLWPKAIKGDGFAIDRILSISDRRVKLLGLVAPTPIMINAQGGNVAIGAPQQNIIEMQQIASMNSDDLTDYIISLTTTNAAFAGLLTAATAAAPTPAAREPDAGSYSESNPHA